MENVIYEYLIFLRIKYSKNYIKNIIKAHSKYPSEISVFDALDNLGLVYKVLRLNKIRIEQLNCPFILYRNDTEDSFKLIKKESDLDFLKAMDDGWLGMVVVIEASSIKNLEHNKVYKKDRGNLFKFVIFWISLFIIIIKAIFDNFENNYIVTILLACTGVIASMFLQAKEFGINSRELDQFCKSGKNLDCDIVTTSNYSKIFKDLSLTNVSNSYFITLLIIIVFYGYEQNGFLEYSSFLFFISLPNLPIVIWSLYIQHFKLKTWCKFCLIIDFALVSLFTKYMFWYSEGLLILNIKIVYLFFYFFFIFIFILVGILLIKSKADDLKELEHNLNLSRRISNLGSIFKYYTNVGDYYNIDSFDNEIRIGNMENPFKILVIKNLYCKPCREYFYKIVNLYQLYPEIYQITFRFKVSGKDIDVDPTTGQYLIQYWAQKIKGSSYEDLKTISFLKDWCEICNLEKFKAKFPLESDFKIGKDIDQMQQDWVFSAQVYNTPTTFFNGYILSPNYTVSDLISLTQEIKD